MPAPFLPYRVSRRRLTALVGSLALGLAAPALRAQQGPPQRRARLDAVLAELVEQLGDRERHGSAYERLVAIGDPAVPRLLDAVWPGGRDAPALLRGRLALRILGDLGPRAARAGALPRLQRAFLELPNAERDGCALAMARIAPWAGITVDALFLERPTRWTLPMLVSWHRVRLGPDPSPEAVVNALRSGDQGAVLAAMQIVAEGRIPPAVLARHGDVQTDIVRASRRFSLLRRVPSIAAAAIVRCARDRMHAAARAEALGVLLQDPDPGVSWRAVRELPELVRLEPARLGAVALDALAGATPPVQRAILACIAAAKDEVWELADRVTRLIGHPGVPHAEVVRVRDLLLGSLDAAIARGAQRRAGPALVRWLRDPAAGLRGAALERLPRVLPFDYGAIADLAGIAAARDPDTGRPLPADQRPDAAMRAQALEVQRQAEAALAADLRGRGEAGALALERFVQRWPVVDEGEAGDLCAALRRDPAPLVRCTGDLRRRGFSTRQACGVFRVVELLGPDALRCAPDVIEWATTPDRGVSVAALDALGALGPQVAACEPAFRARIEGGGWAYGEVADARARCFARIVVTPGDAPHLASFLDHELGTARLRALQLLRETALDRARPADAAVLQLVAAAMRADDHPGVPRGTDPGPAIRAAAARLFLPHAASDAERLDCALVLFADGTPEERDAALARMCAHPGKPVQDVLWAALHRDDRPALLRAAVGGLERLGAPASRFAYPLRDIARSADPELARRARALLERMAVAR